MLIELKEFLRREGEGKEGSSLLGKFVLLSTWDAEGGFLTHHFTAQALKDGHSTILLSLAQSFLHYSSIATKLGVSLTRHQQSGSLVFFDCLTRLLDPLPTPPPSPPHTPSSSCVTFTLDSNRSLVPLYKLLEQSVSDLKKLHPDKPVCLVLDDLNVLLSVGVRVSEVVALVQYCRNLLCSPEVGYVVAMVSCGEECEGGGGEGEGALRGHLVHGCQLCLSVCGLESGCSQDVHGEVSLAAHRTSMGSSLWSGGTLLSNVISRGAHTSSSWTNPFASSPRECLRAHCS